MNSALREVLERTYEAQRRTNLSDPDRLEAVYSSKFWSAPQAEKLRQFCVTASYLLNTPESYVVMVIENEVRVVASNSPDTTYDGALESVDYSLCPTIIGVGKEVAIGNAPETPVICDAGSVRDGGVIAYLGVPLRVCGQIIGSFCVVDYHERHWNEDDATLLSHLAVAVVAMHEGSEAV